MILALSLLLPVLSEASELQFEKPENGVLTANEGHIVLNWTGIDGSVSLFQSTPTDPDKKMKIYEGPENSFFTSGLLEGKHLFQIVGTSGNQDQVIVSVDYPSKGLVLFSLFLGSALFLTLCFIIFRGSRQDAG